MEKQNNTLPAFEDRDTFRRKAYEKFKLWWCISHDITIADIFALYSDYWGEVEADSYDNGFDIFIEENGFHGALWPCYNEFLDAEYQDKELMQRILQSDYADYLHFEQPGGQATPAKIPAILVERDYKGEYERFALTMEEFKRNYPETAANITWPITEAASDTIAPLVHIWFQPCVVGDAAWQRHFTDMKSGLPLSDIVDGNLAYIREDLMYDLRPYLPQPIPALHGEISNLRHEIMGMAGYDYDPEFVASKERQLYMRECQLEAALQGKPFPSEKAQELIDLAVKLSEDFLKQLENKENETSYGEPQAFGYLENGRSIEVTQEQEGLAPEEYYYRAMLHCSDAEYENNDYHSTNGIVENRNTDNLNRELLPDLILGILAANELYPVAEHSKHSNATSSESDEEQWRVSLESRFDEDDPPLCMWVSATSEEEAIHRANELNSDGGYRAVSAVRDPRT